ncbi:MAG: hypothetical protein GEU90_12105 [Gemmatimonas sp.]|nr:hypothetical protein [Gemmatimonas sp.]
MDAVVGERSPQHTVTRPSDLPVRDRGMVPATTRSREPIGARSIAPASVSFLSFHLPTYSPLSLGTIWGAAARSVLSARESAVGLSALLRDEYEADRVVLTGSGAQALQLAIEGAGGERADPRGGRPRVALPAFTCFEVASAAVGAGAEVVIYDVDPETLAPDPPSFRDAVGCGGVAAVVVSPLFGVPIEWSPLREIAEAAGVILIEDAAQGDGARWGGRRLGSMGDLSVLSFGRGKGWSGIRGGALLLRDPFGRRDFELERPPGVEDLSLAIAGVAQWGLGRPSLYRFPRSLPWLGLGETRWHDPTPPRSMARLGAALAVRSRAAAEAEVERRRENAAFYLERLRSLDGVEIVRVPEGGTPGYLRLPVRLPRGISGFGVRPAPLGIEAAYPRPISELPQLQPHIVNTDRAWPGAVELSRRLVTLPTHSRLTHHERLQVIDLVRRYGSSS